MMNIEQFDELVELWDSEGQPPDIDWLEYAQMFRNKTQALQSTNAALLEALEAAQKWLKHSEVCPYPIKHQVAEAIRKAEED
jgi:hypothetical protein